jgi:hypothetical protein
MKASDAPLYEITINTGSVEITINTAPTFGLGDVSGALPGASLRCSNTAAIESRPAMFSRAGVLRSLTRCGSRVGQIAVMHNVPLI